MEKSDKNLRTGFTTGACVTAAAVTAYKLLKSTKISSNARILFPDSYYRYITIYDAKLSDSIATVIIKKDAGDDIDITNGAFIGVNMKLFSKLSDEHTGIILNGEKITISIKRGEGVGIVTSDFLDIPKGKPAVTPGPQNMILSNLELIAEEKEILEIEIFVRNGKKLAEKTLNSTLGVNYGLSILGTSGLVIPCSHNAYKDTINIIIKGASSLGHTTVYFVTGGKTHKLLKKTLDLSDEIAIVRIGDFIHESVITAGKFNFKKVVIGCMAGKLAKYSLGYEYTHATTIRTDMKMLSKKALENGFEKEITEKLANAKSVREFISSLQTIDKNRILSVWAKEAINYFRRWNRNIEYEIYLFDFDGKYLEVWKSN